ncbi:MAG: PP2C family protein-serine/threonine phosphatase [Candidatus Rifleibacteriota bacterium]
MSKHVERKMNLLMVDDAPDNLLLLETILETQDFVNSLFLASSAAEAYEKLAQNQHDAPIDLILMDLMMPEISGIEAIKAIREQEVYRDVPILVVSARSETNALVEAFEAGAVDYLIKPINEEELIVRVKSMLRLKSETDHRKFHEKELEEVAHELDLKNQALQNMLDELHDDLEAAAKMQRSLLPDPLFSISGFDFAWYFEPCETIGGDLLNIFPAGENEVGFFIIDVSGHGIQSAMLAVSAHRMLSAWEGKNGIIRNPDGTMRSPEQVVNELNREFLLQKNNYQYFTMIYGVLDREKRTLNYCRAGHTPLVVQSADGSIKVFDDGNIPVGLSEDSSYDRFQIELEPQSRLILFSDGITEARQESDFFGEDRFFDLIRQSRGLEVNDAVKSIIAGLKVWTGENPLADDITLLIIEAL